MKHIVMYHAPCMDGFAAACLMLWVKLSTLDTMIEDMDAEEGTDIIMLPSGYRDGVPDGIDGAHVYILDFCPDGLGIMQEILERAASVTWYDHHDSKRPIWEAVKDHPKLTSIFDTSRSGAMITFDALEAELKAEHPDWAEFPTSSWHTMRKLIEYVQDRDLFTFNLPDSDGINQALRLLWGNQQRSIDVDTAQDFLQTDVDDHIALGEILVAKREREIGRFIKTAFEPEEPGNVPRRFEGWLATNATTDYTSEIGNRLALVSEAAVGCVFWYTGPDKGWHYELRSTDEGPHVGEIARGLGGGGHPNAAGFYAPTNIFAWNRRRNATT